MKNLKLKGYTNNTRRALHKGNDSCPIQLSFCSASRYKKCCSEKICGKLEPSCVFEMFQFIGKKHRPFARNILTMTEEAKIKKKLAAAVKRCRPVTVTLTVDA